MKKNILGLSLMIACIVLSCKKTNTIPDRFTPVPSTNGNIKFFNMSPDAPPVNIIINNNKATSFNPTSSGNVNGMVFGQFYPGTTGYTSIPSGSVNFQAKVPDSSTVMPGVEILNSTQNISAGKFYTFVLVDSLSRISSVFVEDDPTVPDPTKAYFRVGNFIQNGDIKVEIIRTSVGDPFNKVYASVPFKTVLPFDSAGAGAGQVYKVIMRDAMTDVRLDSIVNFAPTASKKYSLYARGVMGQSGSSNSRRPLIFLFTNF